MFLDEYAKLDKATNGNVGISFDLDGLDPVRMDAVGTPVKNGISPEVFYEALTHIDFSKLICFEVAEYNPALDATGLSLEYMGEILRLVEGRIKNPETRQL